MDTLPGKKRSICQTRTTVDQIDRSIFPLSSLSSTLLTPAIFMPVTVFLAIIVVVDALALLLGKVGARITVYYRREEKTDQMTMYLAALQLKL